MLLLIKGCKSEKNIVILSMLVCDRVRIWMEICLVPMLVSFMRTQTLNHFSQKQVAMHTVGRHAHSR